MQSDVTPEDAVAAKEPSFPTLNGIEEASTEAQKYSTTQANLAKKAIGIINKSYLPEPTPNILRQGHGITGRQRRATAWNAELLRHTKDLKTRTLEEKLKDDMPLPYVMNFKN